MKIAPTSLEEMLYSHVFPVVVCRSNDKKNFDLGMAVGTGFTLGNGIFVTCWHCVSDPLQEDEFYGVPFGDDMANPNKIATLIDIEQEPNGADIAVAILSIQSTKHLPVAELPAYWGRDVVALGFPHTVNTVNSTTGERLIRAQARTLKGYVSSVGIHSTGGASEAKYYELGMPVPRWASGSPLFDAETLEVVGLLAGEWTSNVGDSGDFTVGLALHLDVLRSALALKS